MSLREKTETPHVPVWKFFSRAIALTSACDGGGALQTVTAVRDEAKIRSTLPINDDASDLCPCRHAM